MLDVIWLIPAFPLLGFVLILLFGRRLGEPASGYLASAMVLGSFVVSVGAYFDLLSMPEEERAHVETLFSWVPVESLQIDMAFLADPLSISMALFVTGIAFLIHLADLQGVFLLQKAPGRVVVLERQLYAGHSLIFGDLFQIGQHRRRRQHALQIADLDGELGTCCARKGKHSRQKPQQSQGKLQHHFLPILESQANAGHASGALAFSADWPNVQLKPA